MQNLMVPKNQSENDVESRSEFKDYENYILSNVTFGITILNSKLFMQHFLKLINELYARHLDQLAQTERKRKEEEDKRQKEIDDIRKKKFKSTIAKLGRETNDSKNIRDITDIKKITNFNIKSSVFKTNEAKGGNTGQSH